MNSAQFIWFAHLLRSGFFKHPSASVLWQALHQSLATPPAGTSLAPAQLPPFTPFFAYESGTTTYPTSYALQGITGGNSSGDYIITGTKNLKSGGTPAAQGVVYQGPINSTNTSQGNGSGTWTTMNVPNGINTINNPTVNSYTNTSIYGVDNLGNGLVNLVGSVSPANVTYDSAGFPASTLGFYYQGKITSKPDANSFQVYQPKYSDGSLANYTFIHSVDGGLAVGGYDSFPTRPAIQAFIYNPTASDSNKQKDIIIPGSDNALTKTAYGIWHNQGSSYTIAGGVGLQYDSSRQKTIGNQSEGLGSAYLLDYDSVTGLFSNYKTFNYPSTSSPKTLETHFEGIWYNGNGTYKLPATISPGPNGSLGAAATATITRDNLTGGFSNASWEILPLNSSTGAVPVFTTNDSIFDKASVGAYTLSSGNFSDYAFLNAT
jgi:hypothetical protein